MSDIKSEVIFGHGTNGWNACLDTYINFSQLARYYRESANELLERSVKNTSKLDVHIYSAVFLYRHSVELFLKDLIWASNCLLGNGKPYPKIHNLVKLWNDLRPKIDLLWKSDGPVDSEPLDKKQLRDVKKLLEEITEYDPESFSWRYPFDKEGKRTNSDIHYINVQNLYERFNQFLDNFERVLWLFDYLEDAHLNNACG
ncbi:MAG: hypothetical protein CEE38_07855 [Planctomycetes bacterium B3_Pla]|nr:MAG: hypothetical protein CEE38_07855 [Planctomycetes bacterium B3_Pla]